MTDLRTAAQQALDYWEQVSWGDAVMVDKMDALRAALAEPVQEPVAYAVGRTLHWHEGKGVSDAQLFAAPPQRPAEPVQEPVAKCIDDICSEHLGRVEAFDHLPRGTLLYAILPQRKPLAEWQINDLMADIDPEDRDSWSFRQGVYAAEKHHGVRK